MPRALTQFSLALSFLLVLVVLNFFGALQTPFDFMRLGVNFLNWPVVKTFEKIDGSLKFLTSARDLMTQNQILERQIQELSGEVAALEKDQSENRFLREALGFQAESRHELVPAEVINFDILNVSQTITLNRGRKHGVETGSAVVVPEDILVAVVTEVSDSTAQAELITSTEVTVNAEVLPGRANGIIRGEHGLGILLDLVSQDELLEEGQQVITSGLGGQFPKGFLIGRVGQVISGGPELFQKASVVPAANLRHNKVVFVVKR